MSDSGSRRVRLAQKLSSVKQDAARAITEEFFRKHPDWSARYGERGRQFCTADACFHIDFLAGAIETGSPEAFAAYARWTARMLGARGIDAHTLEETFGQLGEHLSGILLPEEGQELATFLARGREACTEAEDATGAELSGDGLDSTREVFLSAILSGQRQAALNIVEESLRVGHSHVDIYVNLFTESLRRVGALWEQNQISVAQEHIATSITQYAIAAIYPRLVPTSIHRGSMVVTGVAGELHQIGANLVADAMEANGWTVRFLGTNLPHSSIISAIDEISADVLCISTTILGNIPSVVELIQAVRDKLKERTPEIVLGGAAYRLAPQFARDVGAKAAITDLRHALTMLCA